MSNATYNPRYREPYDYTISLWSYASNVWSREVKYGFCEYINGHWECSQCQGSNEKGNLRTDVLFKVTGDVVVEIFDAEKKY